jgi:anti-sigma factor RsiW
VTAPDWGSDHLSPDAVVAYVDDELAPGPHARATQHLAGCRECAAQVVAQGQARAALRTADCPSMPSSLLSSLRSIPMETEIPGPPAGLAVAPDGQLMSVLRPEHAARSQGTSSHGRRPHRGLRFGTGVAVSGLAFGAIAFALPTDVGGSAEPPTATNDSLTESAVRSAATPVDAHFRIDPGSTAPAERRSSDPAAEPALEQLDRIPGSFYGLP